MALDEIISYKKSLLQAKKSAIDALRHNVKPTKKSLYAALCQDRCSFIFEIKPSSPSKGVIRAQADVGAIADIYAPFADAISVLADEKFFGGSLANVGKVASAHKCPVLCKDVVVSPLQIIEARSYGADAVLLMLSVLDDETYKTCADLAADLNMGIITEVHDEKEMVRACKLDARIIGINNRNLRTLEVDITTTERLAPLAKKDVLLIAESGISTRGQVKKLAPQVQGFLIGTALMQAERIDLALRCLLFGRVKICGITRGEDAQAAYEAGAYYGGLNFAEHSKRRLSLDEAAAIMPEAPLVWGGVFVNQSVAEVGTIAKRLGLAFVQIHGDENEEYLADLRTILPSSIEIWRAIRVKNEKSIPNVKGANRIVLDSFSEHGYGGTGKPFDWSILDRAGMANVILAGGINAQNICLADEYAPFAIDIASGVEDGNPRQKSRARINEIFDKLKIRGGS